MALPQDENQDGVQKPLLPSLQFKLTNAKTVNKSEMQYQAVRTACSPTEQLN